MTTMTKRWIVAGVIIIAIGIAGYFTKDYLFQPTKSISEVKNDVEAILTQVKIMAPSLAITYAQPEVEEDGQNFLVTLDDLKIMAVGDSEVLLDGKEQKFILSYEGENIRITPEIPTSINLDMGDADVTAEKENLYLIWSTKVNHFIGGDASFKNLLAKQDGNEFGIASIKYSADLKENSPVSWSGPSKLHLDDIYLQSPVNAFTIKKIEINAHSKDFNVVEYVKILKEFAEKGKKPEDQLPIFIGLLNDKRFLELFGGGGLTLTVKDVNVQTLNGQPLDLKLPEFKFAYNFEDLKSNQARVDLEIYSKDTTSAVTSQMGIDPSAFKIQLNLEKVPLESILADIGSQAQNSSEMIDYPALIRKNLAQAGTKLNIDSLNVDVGPAHLTTKGSLQANGEPTSGIEGEVDFTVEGVDELVSKTGAPNEAKIFIGVIKGLGEKETRSGKDVFVYKLVINPDGKITLNGKDWNALKGLFQMPGLQQPELPLQPGQPQPNEQFQQPEGQQPEQKQEPEPKELDKKTD